MKIKLSVLLLLAFACGAFAAALDIITASPYIDRGVGLRSRILNNYMTVIHHYESRATDAQFSRFAKTIYLMPFRDGSVAGQLDRLDLNIVIADSNETVEASALFLLGLSIPRQIGRLRIKYKACEIGENRLFRNLAISPFGAISIERFIFTAGHGMHTPPSDITALIASLGTALGTRYTISPFTYFYLFTSPQTAITRYMNIGGGKYDPAAFLGDTARGVGRKHTVQTVELSLPVGFGIKRRWLVSELGVAMITPMGTNVKHLNRGNALTDKIVVDSRNFRFFVQLGVHFRQFRKLEEDINFRKLKEEINLLRSHNEEKHED